MDKKAGWETAVAVVAFLAVMTVVFFYLKDRELYIGHVILHNSRAVAGLLLEISVLIITIVTNAISLKHISDEKERKKMKISVIAVSVILVFMLGFTCWILIDDVEDSRKATIAETDIGEGQSLLLVEKEEHFSTSGDSFYEITVYCREGLRLKKIGRQTEYYFLHDNMVRNGQYRVERDGDTVKVFYDYGELTNGLKWKEEYSDVPPEYIEKEYSLK